MIDFLEHALENDNTKVVYVLTLLLVLLVFDFVIGAVMAKLNQDIEFTSFKMKIGIVTKLAEFIFAVVALPLAILVDGGIEMLWVMYIGLCMAEGYSILGHIGVVDDGKGVELMSIFMGNLNKKKGGDKNG